MSYALQIDGLSDVDRQKWLSTLERPPKGWYATRGRMRSRVDPALLGLMGGAGANV